MNIEAMNVRPEAYFAEELCRYQDAEIESAERAERVEDQAQYLLETEFYPFAPENFGEALAQLSYETVTRLAALAEAHTKVPSQALADAICQEVRDYWLDIARYRAEKEVK